MLKRFIDDLEIFADLGLAVLVCVVGIVVGVIALRHQARLAGAALLIGGLLSLAASGFWLLFHVQRVIRLDQLNQMPQQNIDRLVSVFAPMGSLGHLFEGIGLLLLGLAFRSATRRLQLTQNALQGVGNQATETESG